MKTDIAIDEIRATRHRISERFKHDTRLFLDHYRKMEEKYKDRMLEETSESQLIKKISPH